MGRGGRKGVALARKVHGSAAGGRAISEIATH